MKRGFLLEDKQQQATSAIAGNDSAESMEKDPLENMGMLRVWGVLNEKDQADPGSCNVLLVKPEDQESLDAPVPKQSELVDATEMVEKLSATIQTLKEKVEKALLEGNEVPEYVMKAYDEYVVGAEGHGRK